MITPLDLVQKSLLFAKMNKEIYWRESVRLAYYAVYHLLVKKALELQISLRNNQGGVHQQAIYAFSQLENNEAEKLARRLQSMKKLRVKADYQLDDAFSFQNVQRQQQWLFECVDLMNRL